LVKTNKIVREIKMNVEVLKEFFEFIDKRDKELINNCKWR
jgi:hypothetical protein